MLSSCFVCLSCPILSAPVLAGHSVLVVISSAWLFHLDCPFFSVLSRLSFPDCPVQAVLFWLFWSACLVLAVLSWKSYSGFHSLAVLFLLYCSGCSVLAVLSRLSCSGSPLLVVLFCLPCFGCSVLAVLISYWNTMWEVYRNPADVRYRIHPAVEDDFANHIPGLG